MWFLVYEQSINPPVSFHFGILTSLANSRQRLQLMFWPQQPLLKVSELPVQGTTFTSQGTGTFLDDCANILNYASR